MKTFLKGIYQSILSDLGNPTAIREVIRQYPQLIGALPDLPHNIAHSSVVRWDRLASNGCAHATVNGRVRRGQVMRGTRLHLPALESFCTEEVTHRWKCNIRDVQGITNSKSELEKYESVDAFAQDACKTFIGNATEDDLARALNHPGITVKTPYPKEDIFILYLWCSRLLLANTDGSHHFAAASFIAGKLGIAVPIYANVHVRFINTQSLNALRDQFEMIVLNKNPEAMNAFFNAMDEFRASFYWMDLPREYPDQELILLPRKDPRSMQVAQLLLKANAFDLGHHLSALASRQVALHDRRWSA